MLLLLLACAQDPPPFPADREPWTRFKPGTMIFTRSSYQSGDFSGETRITLRLENVLEDRVRLSGVMTEFGRVVARTTPTWTRPRFAVREAVDGIACTAWDFSIEHPPSEKGRVWLDESLKPRRVRSVLEGAAPVPIHRELRFAAEEREIRLGTKTVRGFRLEGTMGPAESLSRLTEWWSFEIPGLLVRAESVIGDGRLIWEVTGVGESPLDVLPPAPPWPRADLTLSPGQSLKDAVDALAAAGAARIPRGYASGEDPGKPRPHRETGYYLLRDGLTIRIDADKEPWIQAARGERPWPPEAGFQDEAARHPLKIEHLAVANSTALFCGKGESWIPVLEIERKGDATGLRGAPALVLRGGREEDARGALKAAGAKDVEFDAAGLPPAGRWTRHLLADGLSLLLATREKRVELAVLEKEGRRVEVEALVPGGPAPERWTNEDWAWPPKDLVEYERLKRRGQLR